MQCRVPVVFALIAWLATDPLTDRSQRTGVTTVLRNGATPDKHQIETMAGGVAVFDFDGDGRQDLFFTNGAPQPSLKKADPSWYDRLYRNAGDFRFENVTEKAGVAGTGFSFGAAAADFDNDGDTDLFVAGMPESHLYRNNGKGSFEDITRPAGVTNRQQWPVGAAWVDVDLDGQLDLFVVNYVRWDPKTEPFCGDSVAQKYRTYCHPKHYEPLPNTLFRNNGDGTFSDVSEAWGLLKHRGKGMGVALADYDQDGDSDLFVANDAVPNFLLRNDRGRFTEAGMIAGVGANDDGRALSSMGVDFRDLDNDGLDDLFITALANETFPVFRNLGKGMFADETYPRKVGAATLPYSGWSNAVVDIDNDGWKDLIAVNGDVQDNTEMFSSRKSRQQSLLLFSQSGKTFRPEPFAPPSLGRGGAFADLDGDGRVDVVLTRLNDRPVILQNTTTGANRSLTVRLRGLRSNRDGIGARVRIESGGLVQWNHATTAVGYASSSPALVHFGLGSAAGVDAVEVRWPSGVVQKLGPQKAGLLTVTEP